jgi:hypothetical protein
VGVLAHSSAVRFRYVLAYYDEITQEVRRGLLRDVPEAKDWLYELWIWNFLPPAGVFLWKTYRCVRICITHDVGSTLATEGSARKLARSQAQALSTPRTNLLHYR